MISGNTDAFFADGVNLGGTGGDTVEGNYIGTTAAGTAAVPNGIGVVVNTPATGDLIYGNLVSGNSFVGVELNGSASTSSAVQANLVGTDFTGTQPVGNGTAGIDVLGDLTTIGGSLASQGNTVEFNGNNGISVTSTDAEIDNCTVYGNHGSGVDNAGTLAIYNSTVTGNAASAGAGIDAVVRHPLGLRQHDRRQRGHRHRRRHRRRRRDAFPGKHHRRPERWRRQSPARPPPPAPTT